MHHIIVEVKYLYSELPQLIYFNSDAFSAFSEEVGRSAISYIGEMYNNNNNHSDSVGP